MSSDAGPRLDLPHQAPGAFRVLEHPADVGFEAFGRTPGEVFANAARALMELMVDAGTVEPSASSRIEVEAPDAPSLLVNWLSEVLYLFDAEHWLWRDFAIERATERSIAAMARGEKFDPARHRIKLLVKAITYHQLALEKTAEGWRAQVYVDI